MTYESNDLDNSPHFGGREAIVQIVEANEARRGSIVSPLAARGYECQVFDSVVSYPATAASADCIVVGTTLDDLGGSVLGERLADPYHSLPLVVISGQDVLPVAPKVLKRATTTLLPANFGPTELVAAVDRSLQIGEVRQRIQERFAAIEASVERLSPREKKVLAAIINGQLNKAIARSLDVSVRTVEGDRAKIVDKFNAETTGEVVGKFAQYTLLTEMGYPAVGSAVFSS